MYITEGDCININRRSTQLVLVLPIAINYDAVNVSQVERSSIVSATIIEKMQKPSWTVVCKKETTNKKTTNT